MGLGMGLEMGKETGKETGTEMGKDKVKVYPQATSLRPKVRNGVFGLSSPASSRSFFSAYLTPPLTLTLTATAYPTSTTFVVRPHIPQRCAHFPGEPFRGAEISTPAYLRFSKSITGYWPKLDE